MQTITKDKFLKLKSGTDVRGVAVETSTEKIELTDEVVEAICTGFVRWYRDKFGKNELSIAVGHDSRISADRIKNAAIKAFLGEGVHVYDCGLATTPSMFMSIVMGVKADASLEITASHHPYQRNGLKFFTPNGGLEGSDVSDILNLSYDIKSAGLNGTIEKYDLMSVYAEHLRNTIIKEVANGDKPLDGLKISVDAGNGTAGFYAYDVLEPLGANVSGSQFTEPNGMFPNHIPNPENSVAIASACEMVKKSKSDFGLIFDTDADRMGCVDSSGREINRNRLVALASVIALEGNPGGTVVTDSLTSDGLREFIEKTLGGKQIRFKRGYKNVIDKSIELNNEGVNSPLAIETSGHAALKENYFLDDGAYLCTKIIIKAAQLRKEGKELDELTAALKEPVESKEVRFKILEPDFRACGEKIINDLTEYAMAQNGWNVANDNREGIRVSFDKDNGDGWFLLRLSVHDPIMPLNIESDSVGGVDIIYNKLNEFLKTTSGLEL